MILTILKDNHPSLSTVALPCGTITPQMKHLARNMYDTMIDSNGIGLAAPQVGISQRIIVYDTIQSTDKGSMGFMFDPVIINPYGHQAIEERCLSFPKLSVKVDRAYEITVEYTNTDNQRLSRVFTGLTAIVIQHEIDHLNGITLLTHANKSGTNKLL